MPRALKINHWLAIGFSLYGAFLVAYIWFYYSFTLPTLKGVEPTIRAVAVLRQLSYGGFLWTILSAGLVLFTAVGMFQARRWSRSLGLFLTGVVPLGYLNRGLLFGAPAVFTWIPLTVFSVAMLVFWLLWKSQEVERVFGSVGIKEKRALLIALGGLSLISVGLFGAVLYVKASYNPPRIKQAGRLIYPRTQTLNKSFTLREVLGLRMVVPIDARVISLRRSENGASGITLGTPTKEVTVLINSESIGKLMAGIGRPIGIDNPYDIHRHTLLSEWNFIFLLVKTMAIPRLGKNLQLKELEAPQWRGLALSGRDGSTRVEYSIYNTEDPMRSATCTWSVRNSAIDLSALERSMGFFEFLNSSVDPENHLKLAREVLTNGRLIDAQFMLAQAYLLGQKNPEVTATLAWVSAELESWNAVARLAKEWLEENPGNQEAKALERKAKKALGTR